MRAKWRGGAAAAFAVVLAACGESSTETTRPGEMRFSFSGDSVGTFEAVGFVPPYATVKGTFATGAVQAVREGRLLNVLAQRERQGGEVIDLILLSLSGAATGTVTCENGDPPCPFAAAFVAGGSMASDSAEGLFAARGGTLVVRALDERRASGTFDFVMEEHSAAGMPRTLRVAGSFDVPLTGL
jgi:hypothetical protein